MANLLSQDQQMAQFVFGIQTQAPAPQLWQGTAFMMMQYTPLHAAQMYVPTSLNRLTSLNFSSPLV
jgi:hypothetical protein